MSSERPEPSGFGLFAFWGLPVDGLGRKLSDPRRSVRSCQYAWRNRGERLSRFDYMMALKAPAQLAVVGFAMVAVVIVVILGFSGTQMAAQESSVPTLAPMETPVVTTTPPPAIPSDIANSLAS